MGSDDFAGDKKASESKLIREADTFHTTNVFRQGDILIKETGPWAASVHSLLQHLESVGFNAAPKVVETGFDAQGREKLTFILGEFIDPGPWSQEACYKIGVLLRELHQATQSYSPPKDAMWQEWFGRHLGDPTVFGHCDFASWNIVSRKGLPIALIDWEYAGPVDPLVELAQACWLNAKLHDDIVAEIEDLPSVSVRGEHLKAILDGYMLSSSQRADFVTKIIEFVVHATANEANVAKLRIDTPLTQIDKQVPWALAWRARAAAWLLANQQTLQKAIN